MDYFILYISYLTLGLGYTPLIYFLLKQRRLMAMLEADVRKLNAENTGLKDLIHKLDERYRVSIESELTAARVVAKLTERVNDLENELAHRYWQEEIVEPSSEFVVLGVWPDTPSGGINLRAAEDALYNSGIRYIPLTGFVDQRRILQQLRWNPDVSVLEIDAHGDAITVEADGLGGGLQLSDGVKSAGWWIRLLRTYHIDHVVLMACESEEVGRALAREGVRNVICVMHDIPDDEAVKFTIALYECLADNRRMADSVNEAKMSINWRHAARIVHINER